MTMVGVQYSPMKKISPSTKKQRDVLRKSGSRVTMGRVALLELLGKEKRPLSNKEIVERFQDENLERTSVYRTLTALEKSGLVRQVNLRHGHTDYELNDPKDHHHIVCTRCDKVRDFEGCNVDGMIDKALRKATDFAEIQDHALELFGICASCAKKR